MNSDFLVQRRKDLGISQNQVAERLRYSPQLISIWESGKGLPGMPIWGEYASLLEIDLEGFLYSKIQKLNDNCDSTHFDGKKFAKKIKRLRLDNDLTQKDLAKKLNVNNKTISMWESGTSFPKENTFIGLCNILKCTFDDLYFAKDINVNINKTKNKKIIPIIIATSFLAIAGLTVTTILVVRDKPVNEGWNADEYFFDDESHWHLDKNGEKIDVVDHEYQITIVKEADCLNDGEETHKCIVCGYSKSVIVAATGHTHDGTWHYNEDYHYHVCLSDSVVFDKESHSFDSGTLSNDGHYITYICQKCNKTKVVEQNNYIINGDTLSFGNYPQTIVSDVTLIESLNELTLTDQNGYYSFGDKLYEKKISTVFHGTSMSYNKFSNGKYIEDNTEYWFEVEPITWRILEKTDDSYLLMSDRLIDAKLYGQKNNYEESLVREWLNVDFYNKAFIDNKDKIQNTEVVNEIEDNYYACSNTFDNVFLPSKFDMMNTEYGFPSTVSLVKTPERMAESTDYARISNLMIETDSYSRYCTRTPDENDVYNVYGVTFDGMLVADIIGQIPFGVRPMIKISRQ